MFRALGKSKIAFILAILFGISLFFFKGGSRYSNLFNSDNIVATVSGTPISTSKFNRIMRMNVDQFGQMLGKKLSNDEIKDFQIQNLVLGSLINNAVFENEFNKIKFLVDETIIAKKTKERIPQIYDSNNKLNEQALNSFLSQQGLKIDDLVDIIEFETKAEIFENVFFQINLPNNINDKINKQNVHEREIQYIKININEFSHKNIDNNNISKDTKDVIDFYNKNLDNYMTKESRDLSYIIINKDNYIGQFTPSESKIKKYYDENKKIYETPEKRNFIQFNFQSNDDAEIFLKNVKNLDTEKIIQYSKDNNIRFNNFENLSKNQVLDELSNEIFRLKIGEISQIIETTLAKHVIIVNNIVNKQQKIFDQVSNEIKEKILSIELENFISELKQNISKDILEGLNINNLSEKYKLQIKYIDNANNNQSIENNAFQNEIIKTGFVTNKDFITDIIDYDDSFSYLLNVENIYPPTNIEYNQIYKKVINDWLLNEKKEFIKKEFTTYDNYLNQLSSQYVKKINSIIINKNNSDLPAQLIKDVFNNELNNQFLYFDQDQDVYIVKINNIIINNDITPSKNSINLNPELKNAFGNEIIKNKNISTNDALLNALINTY